MPGKREESRARTTAAILRAARAQIAEYGGGGLSMRAVAREVGLVSSAVYRYFPTREALLTAMIIESYGHLAAALEAAAAGAAAETADTAPPPGRATRWRALADAQRAWARANPHEFQLIYGTPIPGYVAPPDTVPAAAAVAGPFLLVGAAAAVPGFDTPQLREQMTLIATTRPRVDASGAAAVLAELAALVGFVGLELSGHFVGTADPADDLFAALVARQTRTLGLEADDAGEAEDASQT